MEERDIQAVLEIEELCFTSRWSETMLRYEMSENEFASFYVYEACLLYTSSDSQSSGERKGRSPNQP